MIYQTIQKCRISKKRDLVSVGKFGDIMNKKIRIALLRKSWLQEKIWKKNCRSTY